MPLCAVPSIVELGARSYPNSYKYKNDYILQHGQEISTLIIGGSRPYYAIDAKRIDSATFNLANVAEPLTMDYWLLKRHIDKLISLQTVICEINDVNVAQHLITEDVYNSNRTTYYCRYMHYPAPSVIDNLEISHFNSARSKGIQAFLKTMNNKNDEEVLSCDRQGWGKDYRTPKGDNGEHLTRSARGEASKFKKYPASNYSLNLEALEKIVQLCQSRGIRLIIVTMPLSRQYRDMAEPAKFELMSRAAKHLVESFGVEYKNYMADPRFDGADFYDADHLSHQGAGKITKIICDDFQLTLSE